MNTFADRITGFNNDLHFRDPLPPGFQVMNPFTDNQQARNISEQFYRKYYSDNHPRKLILGINPGRFGAGVTGIPFTDTKRLKAVCGIATTIPETHEPSSVFVYDMIQAYGGAEKFYRDVFIHSVFPLALTTINDKGKEVNCNYYDRKDLMAAVLPFILENIAKLVAIGVKTDVCYCLGTGDNYRFLQNLNVKHSFFGKVIPLEHPRFIMQYRSRQKEEYVEKYVESLSAES